MLQLRIYTGEHTEASKEQIHEKGVRKMENFNVGFAVGDRVVGATNWNEGEVKEILPDGRYRVWWPHGGPLGRGAHSSIQGRALLPWREGLAEELIEQSRARHAAKHRRYAGLVRR